jgi:hypothetical protein
MMSRSPIEQRPDHPAVAHAARNTHAVSKLAAALAVATVALLAAADSAAAQANILTNMRHSPTPVNYGRPTYTGGFTFCRLRYDRIRSVRKSGWQDDYPASDYNFMSRLQELTTTTISQWINGDPGFMQITLDDPDLFRCPFLKMQNAANYDFTPREVATLRDYFAKGGFLWLDDNWTDTDWWYISENMRRLLPEYPIVELTPAHPLMSVMYTLTEVPQIPSIESFRRSGGSADFGEPVPYLMAIFGEKDELLVLISLNNDISDGWEREGDNRDYFYRFSPSAYGVGINVATWVMTR